jgi:hypothetical protein
MSATNTEQIQPAASSDMVLVPLHKLEAIIEFSYRISELAKPVAGSEEFWEEGASIRRNALWITGAVRDVAPQLQ